MSPLSYRGMLSTLSCKNSYCSFPWKWKVETIKRDCIWKGTVALFILIALSTIQCKGIYICFVQEKGEQHLVYNFHLFWFWFLNIFIFWKFIFTHKQRGENKQYVLVLLTWRIQGMGGTKNRRQVKLFITSFEVNQLSVVWKKQVHCYAAC